MNHIARRQCKRLPAALICLTVSLLAPHANAQTWYRQSGGTAAEANKVYQSAVTDTCGVYVYNLGTYSLANSRVRKTGNTSNIDSSNFYGRNAAVLAKKATVTLTADSISTSGIGVNGAFACYAGASLTLLNDTIACAGNYSHGIEATAGATVTATNCLIYTTGGIGASAAATDCGGGIINITGGTLSTVQLLAAGIYSTGTVSAAGTAITTAAEHACVIDGRNSISLAGCTIHAALSGAKIYESHSGDTAHGTAQLTIDGGTITTAQHTIYVDGHNGTKATVTIKGGATLAPASGYIVYTDSGANLAFVADGETMTGNIYADSAASGVDTIAATLQHSTTLSGIVTRAAMSLDATSAWTLTGTSHITTLADAAVADTALRTVSNITGNGHSVYYKAALAGNSWLGSKTYSLVNGGCLLPEGAVCSTTTATTAAKLNDAIRLYPNPAADMLTLAYPAGYNTATVKIMSADGRVAMQQAMPVGGTAQVSVRSLAPGVYVAVIDNGGERKMIRFIKE